jgi:hypothetical protein
MRLILICTVLLVALAGAGWAQEKPKVQAGITPGTATANALLAISDEQQATAQGLRTSALIADKDRQIADLQGQVAQLRLALLAGDLLKDKPGATLQWGQDGKLAIVPAPKLEPPAKPAAPKGPGD